MKSPLSAVVMSLTCFFSGLTFAGTDANDMKEVTPSTVTNSDAGFYIAAYGGGNFNQSYGSWKVVDMGTFSPGMTGTSYGSGKDGSGWAGGLKFGYNFDSHDLGGTLRLQLGVEGDVCYLGSHSKQENPANAVSVPDVYRSQYNDCAFMVNGIARLKTGTVLTPYLGVGIGGEYLSNDKMTDYFDGTKAGFAGANDVAFAVEGLAGFDLTIAKGWSIFFEYKYLAAINPKFNNQLTLPDQVFTSKFEPGYIGQQMATAGMKFSF